MSAPEPVTLALDRYRATLERLAQALERYLAAQKEDGDDPTGDS